MKRTAISAPLSLSPKPSSELPQKEEEKEKMENNWGKNKMKQKKTSSTELDYLDYKVIGTG